jgi:tRNA uridine 5-carbamoylmethylation protein Kti12
MQDKVPYDVYVKETRPFTLSDKPSNEAREDGLSALDEIERGQQVIVIFKSNVVNHSSWFEIVSRKLYSKKSALWSKDKERGVITRKFKSKWVVVDSANSVKKLRQNRHLVIERVR